MHIRTRKASSRFRAVAVAVAMIQVLVFTPFSPAAAAGQNTFRWRDDSGTWTADEATALTGLAKESSQRLRFGIEKGVTSDTELLRQAATVLDPDEMAFTSVIDTVNGYAYLGLWTTPGKVVKLALNGSGTPTRVATLELDPGETRILSAVIDAADGYAYFFTYEEKIVKVALNGSGAPTRVGAYSFGSTVNILSSAVIDTVNNYAYFAGEDGSAAGKIHKIALGSGSNPPTFVGTLTFNSGENGVGSMAIDPSGGYLYASTTTSPSKIVKVNLNGSGTPTRVNVLTLDSGENNAKSAAIDLTDDAYAYFLTDTDTPYLVKVDVSGETPSRVAALSLTGYSNGGRAVAVDAANDYAYVFSEKGWSTNPADIVKVDVSGASLSVSSTLTLNSNEEVSFKGAMVIDPSNGYGYAFVTGFGYGSTGAFVKFAFNGTGTPTRVGALSMASAEGELTAGVIDAAAGYAYFGTNTSPAKIIKMSLGSDGSAPVKVSSLTLETGESNLTSAVIDTVNGYAYFGTGTSPGRVIKVYVGGGTPYRVGAVTLGTDEDYLESAVIDTTDGYAYFGTGGGLGYVVKVSLNGSGSPVRIGALALESGETDLYAAVGDPDNDYAYFSTYTSPSYIVKIAFNGSDTPTRVGALMLNSGEEHVWSGAGDAGNGYAYFGTDTSPGIVVKVAFNGTGTPTRVGALTLEAGEEYLDAATIDTAAGYAYFGTWTEPGIVVKVDLNGSGTPTRVAAVSMNADEKYMFNDALIDPTNGYAYFVNDASTYSASGMLIKVSVAHHFVLQSAQTSGACGSGLDWTNVSTSGTGHWTMAASANVTNGGATTDDAGLSNGGTSFVAGQIFDTTNFSSANHLATDEFTEFEWSVKSTSSAVDEGIYCFRVSNAGTVIIPTETYAKVTLGDPVPSEQGEGDVNITASVDQALSFSVGADSPSGTCASFSVGGTVALGIISPTTVASSGVGEIYQICTTVSTNSTTGYVVTVVSANGALASAGTPADTIPATPQTGAASLDADVDGGEQHYGLCFGSGPLNTDYGLDTTTPVGIAATASSPFSSTCVASSANDQSIGKLTTTASEVMSGADPVQNNWSTLRVKAAISTTTSAHADYADTLTFVATSTF